ncbi:unnamed protein product [Arabidopsis halleri]
MNLQKVFRAVAVLEFDREAYQATQMDHTMFALSIWWFNISITPSFGGSRIVLSKHLGVVFCFANIRGWWEYGYEWHKACSLAKTQNCFDGFNSGVDGVLRVCWLYTTEPSEYS